MKKTLTILLLTFYISFNTGLLVHFHFCSYVFNHLTVLVEPSNCCGNDCSCCHNATYNLSVNDDYDSEGLFAFHENKILHISLESPGSNWVAKPSNIPPVTGFGHRPLIQSGKHPIYLSNRTFLI